MRQFNRTRFSAIDPKYLPFETEEVVALDDAAPVSPPDGSVADDTYWREKFASVSDLIISSNLENGREHLHKERLHAANEATRYQVTSTQGRRVESEVSGNPPFASPGARLSLHVEAEDMSRFSGVITDKSKSGDATVLHHAPAQEEYTSLSEEIERAHSRERDAESFSVLLPETSDLDIVKKPSAYVEASLSADDGTGDGSQRWASVRLSPALRSDEGELEF